MRGRMPYFLLVGSILTLVIGCSRFRRSQTYDPFATARQSAQPQDRVATESARTQPSGQAPDVTPAGREFKPRPLFADRARRQSVPADDREFDSDRSEDSFDPPQRSRMVERPANGNTLDHAPDYSWVQGKLEYTALGGGIWRVRYAPLSSDDMHGGCVILDTPPDPKQFRVGDLVYVEGRVVDRSARGPLPNPVYQVEQIAKAND